MKLTLQPDALEAWETLKRNRDDHLEMMERLAGYLMNTPCGVTEEDVAQIVRDCGLDPDEAYRLLLAGMMGLDVADNPRHALLYHTYLRPRRLTPERFTRDAYFARVPFRTAVTARWQLGTGVCRPYQLFTAGEPAFVNGTEIQPLGYFAEPYSYLGVMQDGNDWMTLLPNEIITSRPALEEARGSVTTFGLGLGYFAFHASEKDTVSSVTCVERDPEVIGLFNRFILPCFPHREKIRVIEDDAFRYAREVLPGEKCDFVFADIWRDVSDGLPCYLRFRALEHLTPHTVWRYWIEPSMLSHLRYTVFSFLEDAMEGKGELPFSAGQRSVSPDDLKTWLSDDFLRKLAGTDLMK